MLTLVQFIEEARARRDEYRRRSKGRVPSVSQLSDAKSGDPFVLALVALTSHYRSMSESSRNPTLESLLKMAAKLDNATFLRLVRSNPEPKARPDFVEHYIKRLNAAFEGLDDFRSIMDDLRNDQRVKSKEMTAIAESTLGYGLGKISKKTAQTRIIDEYSKSGVAKVAVAAAKRSKLF